MLGEKCLNPQRSEGAGVSEAMVANISKKLGFTGFRDFRAGVAQYIRLPTADLHQDLSPDDSIARHSLSPIVSPAAKNPEQRRRKKECFSRSRICVSLSMCLLISRIQVLHREELRVEL
jgi:hypothetical protein